MLMREFLRGLFFLSICIFYVSCRDFEKEAVRGKIVGSWGPDEVLPHSFIVAYCPRSLATKFLSIREEEEFYQNLFKEEISESRVANLSLLSHFHPAPGLLSGKSFCEELSLFQIDFEAREEGASVLAALQRRGRVIFWEPNWLNSLSDFKMTELNALYSKKGRTWWTENIRLMGALEEVKRLSLTGDFVPDQGAVIAIMDGGVDYEHPSLKGRIWENKNKHNLFCRDDRWGCNTVHASPGYLGNGEVYPLGSGGPGTECALGSAGYIRGSDCMHASLLAGIIVGRVESGVPGVCPFCSVMNLRVLEEIEGEGKIADSAVLRALRYLSLFEREKGKNLVRVVNLSFGKYQKGRALSLYIHHLMNWRDGIFVVAAAGNEDTQRRIYPAAHSSVLAVAALSATGRKASYSNYGSWVNIAAPGGEIKEGINYLIESTIPGGGYRFSQGTSMAAPIVSGLAGLLLSLKPNLSVHELRDALLLSSDGGIYEERFVGGYNYRNYYPEIDGERIRLLGMGVLNAEALIRDLKTNRNTVTSKERTKIQCASVNSLRPGSFDIRGLLFLFPVFFVLCVFRFERKKNYEKRGRVSCS